MSARVSGERKRRDKTHYLYVAVVIAVAAGVTTGLLAPDFAKSLKPLGDVFISLIKMMISPIIFCTIVLGVGSIAKATTVGKVGVIALGYFMVMSTAALAIGLVVGNLIIPGHGMNLHDLHYTAPTGDHAGGIDFLMEIVPTSLLSSLTSGNVLQTLFVALLVGFGVQRMGSAGQPVIKAVTVLQALVFRLLMTVMYLAPIGAFGSIAAVVGVTGFDGIKSMITLMAAFYLTCILFIVVVLGTVLKLSSGVNIFSLMKYLAREYLLVFSVCASEPAMPKLIAKLEHMGVSKPVVGLTVPTGYSFNLDGTAIYLTMASLFIATTMGEPMSFGEQISLLLFMIIAAKGAAGVTGAGLATLAGGLQAHRPDLLPGVGMIVGIDRFMAEARGLTNFTGNAVAAVVIGGWLKELDRAQAKRALSGADPFDEAAYLERDGADPAEPGHPETDARKSVAPELELVH
jgi:aerobic C4-dicarboxylate transport protein